MKLLILEPYLSNSHQIWLDNLCNYLPYEVKSMTLPGRDWKWRMHASAIQFAERLKTVDFKPDVILASEMMDIALWRSLTFHCDIPLYLYFHESQFTYPASPHDRDHALKRDQHYAFLNYSSALVADVIVFNSNYHRTAFIQALPPFLSQFPGSKALPDGALLRNKSRVISPGIDFNEFQFERRKSSQVPVILWNHRWEYDKDPDLFFNTLFTLQARSGSFKLIVLGQQFRGSPAIFQQAVDQLQDHIIHWGYVKDRKHYLQWLHQADIVLSTSRQDFFGISVVEAICAGCFPLLPNRLAFPEHIPQQYHKYCLYEDGTDLLQKLGELLRHWPSMSAEVSVIQQFQRRYGMPEVVKAYGELFRNTLHLKSNA